MKYEATQCTVLKCACTF